ncbi:hypothetical protein FGIG_05040 [Fasciola gigantica]|uniref:CUB domain-containing protein n=1 Tax=Fasciola gigantica TaxID=46835 RepID=A0A504YVZ7_FASGI|nr:hypothetical protein FGIG_05040 [Fasciola gigantica]
MPIILTLFLVTWYQIGLQHAECATCTEVEIKEPMRLQDPECNNENGPTVRTWKLNFDKAQAITLRINSLKIPQSASCKVAYLEVKQLRGSAGKSVLRKTCGEKQNIDVSIPVAKGIVTVYTAEKDTEFSLDAFVYNGCEPVSETGTALSSPVISIEYPSNTRCVFDLSVDSPNRVDLKLEMFETQECPNCGCDYMEITETVNNAVVITRYCGRMPFYRYIANGNSTKVVFQADNNGNGKGFRLLYNKVLPEQVPNPTSLVPSTGGMIEKPAV